MTPANVRRILLLLFIALVGLGVYVANHSENTTTSRKVTRIEAASPCLTYGPKSDLCKESFEKAVLTITHPEACAILRKAGLEVVECAGARLRQERTRHQERARSKGVVDSNGHAPSSQLSPQHGGSGHQGQSGTTKPPVSGKDGSKGAKKHATAGEPQSEPPPEPSLEASAGSPTAQEDAGNSGETPAAQNSVGVKACIEVAVSACADVGLPKPQLP